MRPARRPAHSADIGVRLQYHGGLIEAKAAGEPLIRIKKRQVFPNRIINPQISARRTAIQGIFNQPDRGEIFSHVFSTAVLAGIINDDHIH